MVNPDPRRALPAVGRLVESARALSPELPDWSLLEGARRALAAARAEAAAGVASLEDLASRAARAAKELARPRPGRVVNATGVVLHTNLGRAVLAPGAARAAAEAGSRYSDLELDLASGGRGKRLAAVNEKLRLLSGADGALAVNNNAAAVLLALDTHARGREVIVSRGELVEIGGSFRVPEILERAGVRLVEVGTTNRTHPRDYANAIGPDTALLLKVHRSNFVQRGFVTEVDLPELAEIGRAHGLPLVEDLGSATFVRLEDRGFPPEAWAPGRLKAGADLVCFSGDKLLAGPQAGLVIGREDLVGPMASNPLARALRLDKLGLAALDWTLGALLGDAPEAALPALGQLTAPAERLEPRARALAARLAKRAGDVTVTTEPDRSAVGGGTLPGFELATWAVTLRGGPGATALAARLRAAAVPVLARVRDDALILDVRTLLDGDEDAVENALVGALQPASDGD